MVVVSCFACMAGCANNNSDSPDETFTPMARSAQTGELSQQLNDVFEKHYTAAEGRTYEQLIAEYNPQFLSAIEFDVKGADYYDNFVSAFELSDKAVKILDELGFVVVNSPARESATFSEFSSNGAGPADIFYRVFANDLPVFVSADSVLHAWHRTFDKIMETTEAQKMVDLLKQMLDKTMGALDGSDPAGKDALFYLAVSRALLDAEWQIPSEVKVDVDKYLSLIASKQLDEVDFMGQPTFIDFSQFAPRGHYTRSEKLEKYFMAMMWLGRTDLVLYDDCPQSISRPREEVAARALAGAMKKSGGDELFNQMDQFYAVFVGRTNAINPSGLLSICEQAGLDNCQGDYSAIEELYAQQPVPSYSSRVFTCDEPPIAMRFFPQRFGYGAWVTSRTTTPRLKPAVEGGRAMAITEDVLFALGADRAVKYFEKDMEKENRQNLPATLEAARKTMEEVTPTQLDNTVYNHWLEALTGLSASTIDSNYPQVMRTAKWHDRKLEAVAANWAEMRHDTILIVEQSTGGIGCQYPKGYVEPVPQMYASISDAAALIKTVYLEMNIDYLKTVPECMDHWQEVLAQLKAIAEKEIAGQPMTEAQLTFITEMVDLHGTSYYGDRMFDGWYPQLYWHAAWTGKPEEGAVFNASPSAVSEPIIADVHTDAENQLALEVGTGHPGMMVVAIDNQGDISLYGGPVMSFYQFETALSDRYTDEKWLEKVEKKDMPARPSFARSYWED